MINRVVSSMQADLVENPTSLQAMTDVYSIVKTIHLLCESVQCRRDIVDQVLPLK